MKLLVVGFGKMGMLHAATLKRLPGVREVIIAERSPLIRRAITEFDRSARVIADFQEAFGGPGGDPAGAVIATPTASHAPILKSLLPKVRGIFVEKPLASGFADAWDAVGPLSEKLSSSVMVGHCLRFSPVFGEAKRLLDLEALGTVTRFEASMFSSDVLKASGSWRFKGAHAGGGVLLDLGSHLVDMTRHLFGTPARVKGSVRSVVSAGAEDAFESDWSYSGTGGGPAGLTGKLTGSWSAADHRKATLTVRVQGTNGSMEISDDAVELDLIRPAAGLAAGPSRVAVTALETTVPFDLAGPMYARQLETWLASLDPDIATQRPVTVNTVTENLIDLALLDAIRDSRGVEKAFEIPS